MKFILLIFSLLLCSTAYSQTVTYFNEENDTVTVNDKWSYYIQLRQENPKDSIWIEEKMEKNGQMLRQKFFYYKNPDKHVRHGKYQKWDSEGNLLLNAYFNHGYLDGNVKNFWKNGQPKRDDTYQMGRLVSGHCYDSLRNEIPHFPYEEQPLFKGGTAEMQKFIAKNIMYPEKALKKKITGKVVVLFIINKDGSLSGLSIKESVSPELDNEALRVVKLMDGLWTPGYQDGEAVRIKMVCPIKFNLKK